MRAGIGVAAPDSRRGGTRPLGPRSTETDRSVCSTVARPRRTSVTPGIVGSPNCWSIVGRRRSRSTRTTRFPARAYAIARFEIVVDLPSSPTALVIMIACPSGSTFTNSRFVRSIRYASASWPVRLGQHRGQALPATPTLQRQASEERQVEELRDLVGGTDTRVERLDHEREPEPEHEPEHEPERCGPHRERRDLPRTVGATDQLHGRGDDCLRGQELLLLLDERRVDGRAHLAVALEPCHLPLDGEPGLPELGRLELVAVGDVLLRILVREQDRDLGIGVADAERQQVAVLRRDDGGVSEQAPARCDRRSRPPRARASRRRGRARGGPGSRPPARGSRSRGRRAP